MSSQSTMILVQSARDGDRDAWDALIERFYKDWLNKFHGDLGTTIRRLYDTADLVQSALRDALRDIRSLRNEAVFYAWVTSIIRHKIANQRRRLRKEVVVHDRSPSGAGNPVSPQEPVEASVEKNEILTQTLDTILALWPEHPEEMVSIVWKLLDNRPIHFISQRLEISERSVFNRLRSGMELLKGRLGA